jgi:putative ABC transport system permease protein
MWSLFRQLRLRFSSVFQKGRVEQELDEELQYHLDRQIAERLAEGQAPEEARYAALRAMGAITQNKEECRDMRAVGWIEDMRQDLRFAVRTLRKNPGFTTVAVLVLGLGIGANTAMFSVAYGILLRPLPYADGERVALVEMNAARQDVFGSMSVRDYLTWQENNRAFEDPALFRTRRMDISGSGKNPEQVRGALVTAGFFTVLGLTPVIGRTFAAGEDNPGAPRLAVLGEPMWQRRFARDPSVLGQSILIGGTPFTVIGVMPRAFQFPRREMEIWINMPMNPPSGYGPWLYRGLARLKPGVTLEQAQTELNAIALKIEQQNPNYKRVNLPLRSLRDAILGTTVKPTIYLLSGAVGLLLLVAVVNVANLILARATVREREMALRLSLGASRSRIMRQLLSEGVLLSILAAVAGSALAWGGVHLIRVWNPGNLPLIEYVRLDSLALAFTVLTCIVTAVLFSLAPALGSANTDLSSTLKEGGRGGTETRAQGRLRGALVVCEIALSFILLVGAGLLLRSLVNLERETGGFSATPRQILSMLVSGEHPKYNDARTSRAYFDEVLRRARNLHGVESVALSDSLPPDRINDVDSFQVEGQTLAAGEMNPVVPAIVASPGFFDALRIPLLQGREFSNHDHHNAAPVVIVTEGFARRFFPNQQAVGKRMRRGGGPWMEIVGVTGNVKYMGLTTDTDPVYYVPFTQTSSRRMYLVVRCSGNAAELAEPLRRGIQSIDSSVTLAEISTMEKVLNRSFSRPRFNTLLLVFFAGTAFLLASVGIYGLIAYWVAQRSHEIGVRMALGAAPTQVVRMVVRQSASLAAAGSVIGLTSALALTHLLKTMVFGVGVRDALTFASAFIAILLMVLVASLVPVLRATRISPVVALR